MTPIIITAVLAFLLASVGYGLWIRRLRAKLVKLQWKHAALVRDYGYVYAHWKEFETQVTEERQLRADLIVWIDIECHKFAFIGRALKQRVGERTEFMRQLQKQRKTLLPPPIGI